MTKQDIKQWLPEITHWANGGNLWRYINRTWCLFDSVELHISNLTCFPTVIEDKHFEARKAFALGEPIKWAYNDSDEWYSAEKPSWSMSSKYRPKKKEWYDEVSVDNPILCWVTDRECDTKIGVYIITYRECEFKDMGGICWTYAEPVKPEECYHE